VIYQYITDQTTQSLGSQIAEFIPKHSRIYTDEGYPFLQGIYKNHKMVNHSVKSRDARYRFSRNRWCQDGIHNQVAEGYNNTIKTAFRSYGYFRPENAGMYLSEFTLMANIRHYGLDAILSSGMEGSNTVNGVVGLVSRGYLPIPYSLYPHPHYHSPKRSYHTLPRNHSTETQTIISHLTKERVQSQT
jgi:hypothetical protein